MKENTTVNWSHAQGVVLGVAAESKGGLCTGLRNGILSSNQIPT